jgi:hypothetical protein
VSVEASDLVSIPRAELDSLRAEVRRLRRAVGRGVTRENLSLSRTSSGARRQHMQLPLARSLHRARPTYRQEASWMARRVPVSRIGEYQFPAARGYPRDPLMPRFHRLPLRGSGDTTDFGQDREP